MSNISVRFAIYELGFFSLEIIIDFILRRCSFFCHKSGTFVKGSGGISGSMNVHINRVTSSEFRETGICELFSHSNEVILISDS